MKFTKATKAIEAYRDLLSKHSGVQSMDPFREVPLACEKCGGGPATRKSKAGIDHPDPGRANHWKDVCANCEAPWHGVPKPAPARRRRPSGPNEIHPHPTRTVRPNTTALEMLTTLSTCLDELRQVDEWRFRIWAQLHVFEEVGNRSAVAQEARKRWRTRIPLSDWSVWQMYKRAEQDFTTILKRRGLMA